MICLNLLKALLEMGVRLKTCILFCFFCMWMHVGICATVHVQRLEDKSLPGNQGKHPCYPSYRILFVVRLLDLFILGLTSSIQFSWGWTLPVEPWTGTWIATYLRLARTRFFSLSLPKPEYSKNILCLCAWPGVFLYYFDLFSFIFFLETGSLTDSRAHCAGFYKDVGDQNSEPHAKAGHFSLSELGPHPSKKFFFRLKCSDSTNNCYR